MQRIKWDSKKIQTLIKLKKDRKTYKEIAKEFGGTERAISSKLTKLKKKGYDLSPNVRYTLDNVDHDLKIASLSLYWAEGTKRGSRKVEFTNSDVRMINLFIKFLYQCGVKREIIKLRIKGKQEYEPWWSEKTGIPLMQFQKRIKYSGLNKRERKNHGTCIIVVNRKELFDLIINNIPPTRFFQNPPEAPVILGLWPSG